MACVISRRATICARCRRAIWCCSITPVATYPAVAGVAAVQREAYPDPTQFDSKHDHYDAASDPDKPRWYMVDVKLVRKFDRVIPLDELRQHATGKLKDMIVLKRGNRLSITPVTKSEWSFIESLE